MHYTVCSLTLSCIICNIQVVSNIAVFVLKRDVKLQPTCNSQDGSITAIVH